MKSWIAIIFISVMVPFTAHAEEEKGFWASLVPDNSSAIGFVESGKAFFGQLFEDGKDTGKVMIDTGKELIDSTGETIKSITSGDE